MFEYFDIIFVYPLVIYYLVYKLESIFPPYFDMLFSSIKVMIIFYELLIALILITAITTRVFSMITTRRFDVLSNGTKLPMYRESRL